MNTWKVVCATLVIFIAGIVTGITLVRVVEVRPKNWRNQRPFVDNRGQPNPPNPSFPNDPHSPNPANLSPGPLNREFIQVLEGKLRLTSEQRERIDKIVAEGQERIRELRTRIDPEMRKELQQTREQIRSVLTPDQREQFEQLMKRPRRNERGESQGQPDRRFPDQRDSRNQHPPMDAPPTRESHPPQPPPQPQEP